MTSSNQPNAPRLLDEVRDIIRSSITACRQSRRICSGSEFIGFHGKRHPRDMGAAEVSAFLSHLAIQRNVAASTQNQALNAILFMYRDVLKVNLPWLTDVHRAKKPQHIPVVFTKDEIRSLLAQL